MAEFLASIFGTEKDRVNCPFYFKIGACCHGERCSRQHNRPTFSQTILLLHMYQNPVHFQKQGYCLHTLIKPDITEEDTKAICVALNNL